MNLQIDTANYIDKHRAILQLFAYKTKSRTFYSTNELYFDLIRIKK